VRVFHGPGGGAELGRPPGAISLSALVRAVDGETPAERCIMGMGKCSETSPCLLHARWIPLQAEFSRMLEETSLDMLVQEEQKRRSSIPEAQRTARGATIGQKPKANKRQIRP
jgi:DNA-binding IscR family transcriptional regulator